MSTANTAETDRRAARQLGLVTLAWLVFVLSSSLVLILLLPG
jgi:hypothetical protein